MTNIYTVDLILIPFNVEKYMLDNYGTQDEFSLFMMRLRKKFGKGIRFLMCGEYGTDNDGHLGRPHYHAIIFNHDFADKELYKENNGNRLYRSDALDKLWTDPVSGMQMGYCSVGSVTIESAGYVARYALKKVTGKNKDNIDPKTGLKYYQKVCHKTGVIYDIEPEYLNMSRMPGIGQGWLESFKNEVLQHDTVLKGDFAVPLPRYYDKLLEKYDPHYLEMNKHERFTRALEYADNNTPERLAVREMIQERKTDFLSRKDV